MKERRLEELNKSFTCTKNNTTEYKPLTDTAKHTLSERGGRDFRIIFINISRFQLAASLTNNPPVGGFPIPDLPHAGILVVTFGG